MRLGAGRRRRLEGCVLKEEMDAIRIKISLWAICRWITARRPINARNRQWT